MIDDEIFNSFFMERKGKDKKSTKKSMNQRSASIYISSSSLDS